MVNYLSLSDFTKYDQLRDLWNKEVGFIYPITSKLFASNVLECKYFSKEDSYVAIINNKVVGFIISKIWSDIEEIPEYENTAWISLFYVSKNFRKQGIGSNLLQLAEEGLLKKENTTIHLGRDINNFFPGIPIDFNNLSPDWFKKRGFEISYQTHDVIGQSKKIGELLIKNTQFVFRLATINDKQKLLKFLKDNFSNRWEFEAKQYFDNMLSGNKYLIVLDNDEIIAFSRINDSRSGSLSYNITWYDRFNALGGIGPLGVGQTKRKIGLGYDIVAWSINYLVESGVSDIIIDWTGLVTFYQQFGFEVWKTYFYAVKKFE